MHASSQLSNSALENDRLSQENMLLKLKLLEVESQVGSDISSLHEASFAEEMHNTIKSRDIILEKAKLSILTLQTENEALSRQNQAKQTQIGLLNDELGALRQQHSELRDKFENQYQELVQAQQSLVKLENDYEKQQTEMREKEFLIADLQKRFCNMEQTERDFNSQFTQHLKAVDLGYEEQLSKLRQTFAEQTDKIYSERQAELNLQREKSQQHEDLLREAKSAVASKTNECEQLGNRLDALQTQSSSQKQTIAELSERLNKFDAIAVENEQNKLKHQTAEQFAEELKKKVAELIQERAQQAQIVEKAREKHEKLVLIIKQLQAEGEKHQIEIEGLNQQNDTKTTQLSAALETQQSLEKEAEQLRQSYKQLVSKNEITDKSLLQINSEFQQLERNHEELQQYYSQIKDEYDLAVSTLQIAQKEQSQTESLISELKQNCQKFKLDSEENEHEVQILTERITKFKASLEEQTRNTSDFSLKNSQLSSENGELRLENDRLSKENEQEKESKEELQQALTNARIQVEEVLSEHNQLKTEFELLSSQNQATEAQLSELLQDKEKAEQFAVRKGEKYLEAEAQTEELQAFEKQVSQQVRELHQEVLSKLGVQSSIFSPKSSVSDGENKAFELYSLLGEIKTKFAELCDAKSQREFEIVQLNDRISGFEKEIENEQAQAQYEEEEYGDLQAKCQEAAQEQSQREGEVFQLKAKLQEAEETQQQAIEQRNQLKQQKEDQTQRIEELTRKLREAKAAQESLQAKLSLEARQIQEQFGGQIRNFYNKCMVLGSLEELKNEINALYVRIGV